MKEIQDTPTKQDLGIKLLGVIFIIFYEHSLSFSYESTPGGFTQGNISCNLSHNGETKLPDLQVVCRFASACLKPKLIQAWFLQCNSDFSVARFSKWPHLML